VRDPVTAGYSSSSFSGSHPTNVRWQIFALSCASSWTLYLHRYTFALVMPSLAEEWNVDRADLGFMQSAFYATYVAMQVPCGLLVDWLGTHLFLGGIILAWSGVLALHAWAPDRAAMYAMRILFGATQAGCYPALGKVTQAWFPLSIRTSLQAWIASFSGRFGGASANLLFGTVMLGMVGLGWRSGLLILAAWGAALGVAVLVVFRTAPAEHPRVNVAELHLITGIAPGAAAPHETSADTASIFVAPDWDRAERWWKTITARSAANLGFFFAQFFAATFADTIYVVWMPTVLKSEHRVSDQEMGFYSALPLLGGALGGIVGGYANDLLIRRLSRRWARSIVGCVGNVMAAAFVLVALLFFHDPARFCGFLFFAKVFSDWAQPTTWGTVTDFSGRHAATIFGLGNGVGGLGSVVAPPLLGAIATAYSWHAVFALIAAIYVVGGACWLAVNCTIPVLATREPDAGA
jgi:ACS family glucarate transporter-like MFS transporter/ACS family D-galactonate transporter-like MFS transporter